MARGVSAAALAGDGSQARPRAPLPGGGANTGHLMSALAVTYANTGNRAALDNGRYVTSELAAPQELAP